MNDNKEILLQLKLIFYALCFLIGTVIGIELTI